MLRYTLHCALLLAALLISATAWAASDPGEAAPSSPAPGLQGAADSSDALPDWVHDALFDHDWSAGDTSGDTISQRRRVYRRRYRRYRPRTRVRYRTAPRTRVVVRSGRRGYVDDGPTIVARPSRSGVTLGLRFALTSLGDTALRYETFEGATLGGVGVYARAHLLPHWGVEFAFDVLGAETSDYQHVVVPMTVSLMAHLFPDSPIDVYGLAGFGLYLNAIQYYPSGYDEDYAQFGGHLGAGVAFDLGPLQLTSDLRWIFLQARPEHDDALGKDVAIPATDANTPDDVTHALQFTFGVGANF